VNIPPSILLAKGAMTKQLTGLASPSERVLASQERNIETSPVLACQVNPVRLAPWKGDTDSR